MCIFKLVHLSLNSIIHVLWAAVQLLTSLSSSPNRRRSVSTKGPADQPLMILQLLGHRINPVPLTSSPPPLTWRLNLQVNSKHRSLSFIFALPLRFGALGYTFFTVVQSAAPNYSIVKIYLCSNAFESFSDGSLESI